MPFKMVSPDPGRSAPRTISSVVPEGPNPYPGPRTFRSNEADRFFGREREARELLSFILSSRTVLFYAQSGAGKSSLVNTRIIPELIEEGFEVLPIGRVSGESSPEIRHNIFIHNLMASLEQDDETQRTYDELSLSDFLLALALDPAGRYTHQPISPDSSEILEIEDLDVELTRLNRILILDQFEEILTTNLQAWQQRDVFFDQIREAMETDPYLHLLFVIREDHVAGLDPYVHRLPERLQTRYYMERMKREAAIQAVRLPAAAFGRPFEEGVAETLVDSLRLIRVSGYPQPQPGQYIEPVQLQVVCRQLWETLQARDSAKTISAEDLPTGYVDQAMVDFYETTLFRVSTQSETPERLLRDWVDNHLITATGTRGIVYRNEEIGNTAGLDNDVVDQLVRNFLLRTEARAGSTWYELVHDRLVEPIQQSNRDWQTAVRARRTDALQFANQVQALLATNHADRSDLALLLAREAVLTTLEIDGYVEPAADAALRRAITEAPPWEKTLAPSAHAAEILTVFFSPDGKQVVSASLDGTARIWDVESREQLRILQGHSDRVYSAVFSPDGERVVTAGADGMVLEWRADDGQILNKMSGHENEVYCARYSSDGNRVASCGSDGSVRIWDVAHSRELCRFENQEWQLNWLDFNPDGSALVAGSAQGDLLWLDPESADLLQIQTLNPNGAILWISFDGQGKRIACACDDGRIELRSGSSGELTHTFETLDSESSDRAIWVARFSPDGAHLLSAGHDGWINLYDLETRLLTKQFHLDLKLTGADFAPDGSGIIAAGFSPLIFTFDRDADEASGTLGRVGTAILAVHLHPGDPSALALYAGEGLVVWDLEGGREQLRIDSLGETWSWARFIEQGAAILVVGDEGLLRRFDSGSGDLLSTLAISDEESWKTLRAIALSTDERLLALAHETGLTQVNLEEERVENSIEFGPITALAFDTDADWLYVSRDDGAFFRVEGDRMESLGSIPEEIGSPAILTAVGDPLIVGCESEGSIQIWDPIEARLVNRIDRNLLAAGPTTQGMLSAVTAHRESETIAIAGIGHGIALISSESMNPTLLLTGDADVVHDLSFDAEGTHILSGAADGALRLWRTRSVSEPQSISVREPILWSAIDDEGPLYCGRNGQLYRCDFEQGSTTLIPLPIAHWNESACAWWRDEEQQSELSLFHASGVLLTLNISEPQSRQEFLASFGSEGVIQVGPSLRLIATSDGFGVTVWDPDAGTILLRKALDSGTIRSIALSPDDTLLAAATTDETILVWDLASGREVHRLTGHSARINAIEFSPDGGWLASAAGSGGADRVGSAVAHQAASHIASRDTSVRLWQISSGRERLRVGNHSQPVRSIRFSPDGRQLLTAGADGSVRIFNAGSGEEMRRLLGHNRPVNSAHYSLDGRRIVSSSDQEISFWRADLADVLSLAESLIQRQPAILMGYERDQYRHSATR